MFTHLAMGSVFLLLLIYIMRDSQVPAGNQNIKAKETSSGDQKASVRRARRAAMTNDPVSLSP